MMRVFAILSLAIAACEASEPQPPPLDLPAGCNPLMGGVDCFLPYPSDVSWCPIPVFRQEKSNTPAQVDDR